MASANAPVTSRGRETKARFRVGIRRDRMLLFVLEALLALVILVAIVWWTMFAGRHKGEMPRPESKDHKEDDQT